MDLCPSFLQRTMHITFPRIFSRRYLSLLKFGKWNVLANKPGESFSVEWRRDFWTWWSNCCAVAWVAHKYCILDMGERGIRSSGKSRLITAGVFVSHSEDESLRISRPILYKVSTAIARWRKSNWTANDQSISQRRIRVSRPQTTARCFHNDVQSL